MKWCICLTKRGSQYCAVHAAKGKDFHVGASDSLASDECDECAGTGECQDCDGDGTHECDHRNCYEMHDCPTCDGTGHCQECARSVDDPDSFDARYLAFAFDAGWVPPVLIDYPWDEA